MSNTVVGILGLLTIIAVVVTLFKSKTQPAIAFIVYPFILGLILVAGGRIDFSNLTAMIKAGFNSTAPTAALFVFSVLYFGIMTDAGMFDVIIGKLMKLQTFFHNPIAGPFVLGISSGAKLTVSVTMIFLLSRGAVSSSASLIFSAFLGAMISMGFVLLISQKVKQMSLLVVCGVMIGYICSALTDFLVTFADDSNIVNLHNWSVGSFSGRTWMDVRAMVLVCGGAVALSFLLSKPIRAYQLGEVYAQNMGVHLKAFRAALILLSSVLSACVTAFAGPISFVGIAVPHLMKRLFGTAEPMLMIPACFLGGGAFCLMCDLIARTAFAPTEVSISSVTAVFGAPVVIYMMLHRKAARE